MKYNPHHLAISMKIQIMAVQSTKGMLFCLNFSKHFKIYIPIDRNYLELNELYYILDRKTIRYLVDMHLPRGYCLQKEYKILILKIGGIHRSVLNMLKTYFNIIKTERY